MTHDALLADDKTSVHLPPVAKRLARVQVLHGERRVDEYYWLREKTNPEVIQYLEAENAYAATVMKPTEALQELLYEEMLGRIQQTDLSVPYRYRGYVYFMRTEEGKQYPIHCRRKDEPDAAEQILLDLNEMAKGQEFIALGEFAVSDDGNLLAYSTDNTGFREYALQVKDLRANEVLPERIEKTGSVAWASDGKTLFYTVEDAAKRSYRLYRHVLGSTAADELIYEETDERFRVGVARTRSLAYLLLTTASHTASEVRYLGADNPEGEWGLMAPREENHEYYADHRGSFFFIRTNSGGRNFRIVTAPVADPQRKNWKEEIAHRADVMLAGMDIFAGHMALLERDGGLPHLRVAEIRDAGLGASDRVELPEPVYMVGPGQNPEFETGLLRFTYQSLVTPSSVFDYDVRTHERKLLKQTPVLGGYDASQYQSERVFAKASDGAQVPLSLVYRKGLARDGCAPLLLYGYGSYGMSVAASFNSNRLSLLDRGFVYAIAHVRGGGEMGKTWHDQGRMLNKKNTFSDFIAAAEHLIAQKYTSRESLIIEGGSAGGLLMGAVANLRPGLFRMVISHVPFVDVINTMSDATLPLTVGEYEEWGNPQNKTEYEYMKSYCPCTNLEDKDYPAMLLKTSLHDSQVMYWEPAKYAAKLRALKTDSRVLLLKTNMAAGHGGPSGRYDYLREIAFAYAFMLWQLGRS